MNKKYKMDPKSLALMLSICLVILLIAIAVIIRFYSIRVLLTALVCAIIPFAFITIYMIMVLYALKDFLIKRLGSLLEHTT